MSENRRVLIPPLPRLHHIRSKTIYQTESKAVLAKTVRQLLLDCGVAPRKLKKPKSIFAPTTAAGKKPFLTTPNTRGKAVVNGKELEVIRRNLRGRCKKEEGSIGVESVNKMLYNLPYHVVALFKEYLILDDMNEFLHRFYQPHESEPRLKKIAEYYSQEGKAMPSYALFDEGHLFAKRKKRQAKILLMRYYEKLEGMEEDQTSLFSTKFMQSVFREDLQNSRTCILSDKSHISNHDKLEDLMTKLNQTTSTKSILYNTQTFYQSCPKRESPVREQDGFGNCVGCGLLGNGKCGRSKKVAFKGLKRVKSLGSAKANCAGEGSRETIRISASTHTLRNCKAKSKENTKGSRGSKAMCQTQRSDYIKKFLKAKLNTKIKETDGKHDGKYNQFEF